LRVVGRTGNESDPGPRLDLGYVGLGFLRGVRHVRNDVEYFALKDVCWKSHLGRQEKPDENWTLQYRTIQGCRRSIFPSPNIQERGGSNDIAPAVALLVGGAKCSGPTPRRWYQVLLYTVQYLRTRRQGIRAVPISSVRVWGTLVRVVDRSDGRLLKTLLHGWPSAVSNATQRNVRLQYSTVVTLLAGVFGGCGGCLIGQLDERTVALPSRRRTIPMFILPINERIFRTPYNCQDRPNQTPLLSSTRMATAHRGLLHHTSACDSWHNPQSLLVPAANGSSRSTLRETSFKHISSRCWKNCPNRTRASAPKVG